jgi:hypothetical protein
MDTKPYQDKKLSRKVAVITGATSGIGKAYAEYFASHDYDLLITGRRKEIIIPFAKQLMLNHDVGVEVVIADLTVKEEFMKVLKAINNLKNIGVLINNAGYCLNHKFSSDQLDHQLGMLKAHVDAPVMLIHHVLPEMMKNKGGIIINVSSLAAYIPTADNSMYSSTKTFLINFSESLHLDVFQYGIKVQCLCPGLTFSDFHRDINLSESVTGTILKRLRFIPWMKPDRVVRYSISCLNKGKVICIPGFRNRVFKFLVTLVPRPLYYMISRAVLKAGIDNTATWQGKTAQLLHKYKQPI